jgi:hypothetical protein
MGAAAAEGKVRKGKVFCGIPKGLPQLCLSFLVLENKAGKR